MGFLDKTRVKSENIKMELAIPQDRVDIYLSFSERIIPSTICVPKVMLN